MKNKFTNLASYIDHLRMDGCYYLSRKRAIEALQISQDAFKLAAYRLAKKGMLKRIRGDFFIVVPPEHRAIGSLPATWFIDALMKYLDQEYYIGGLSAGALLGSAHQQPMALQVVTNKYTRAIQVGRVSIVFLYKRHISSSFYNHKKSVSGTIQVSTPEMTAFDLIRYMYSSGQINTVATVFCELAEQISPEALASLVQVGEIELACAQRLGYILEELALPINLRPLKEELKKHKLSRRLLVTKSLEPIIGYNKVWHIEINESLEPDDL